QIGAEKKLTKRDAERKFRRCDGDKGCAPLTAPPFAKGGRKRRTGTVRTRLLSTSVAEKARP
ncbi:MAG: hypothetical protein ACI3XL_04480, partial [Eubacteriales bacterium]